MTNTVLQIESVDRFLELGQDVRDVVVQNVDFTGVSIDWEAYDFRDTVFLGCEFDSRRTVGILVEDGALVFPRLPDLPYRPYRASLYSPEELHSPAGEQIEGAAERAAEVEDTKAEDEGVLSYDEAIYRHFVDEGRHEPHILEALARRIHDHAIDDALGALIDDRDVVGVMGGHSTGRDDPYFRKVAVLTRKLTRAGYFVASGGGPGIMEAANLGAYFARYEEEELLVAVDTLAASPGYRDEGYMQRAREVRERFPDGAASLAIPTWFYGHEPSNFFGTHVAKYFSNSIREDGLLAISVHGVIFAPGAAGTTQEIFMDATQNHYGTFDWYSPMVFLGRERYKVDTFLYPLLEQLAWGREYAKFLHLTDEPQEAFEFLRDHPPEKAAKGGEQ